MIYALLSVNAHKIIIFIYIHTYVYRCAQTTGDDIVDAHRSVLYVIILFIPQYVTGYYLV